MLSDAFTVKKKPFFMVSHGAAVDPLHNFPVAAVVSVFISVFLFYFLILNVQFGINAEINKYIFF